MSVSTPSQGTHFSDGVRTGPIIGSSFVPGVNVLTPSQMVSSPIDQLPPGVFNTPMSLLDIIPAAEDVERIAPPQTPPAAADLALTTASGYGVTIITFNGISNVLKLDCARNIIIGGSVGTTSQTFTIFGWDEYGIPLTEQITGPVGETTAVGKKSFLYIQAVNVAASPVGDVSVGAGSTFGLPYLMASANYIGIPEYRNTPDVFVTFDTLENDPITTVDGQSIVTVDVTGATPLSNTDGMVVGQWITLRGLDDVGGITASQLNIVAQIVSIPSSTTFTYKTNGVATSSDTGGGADGQIVISNTAVTGDQRIATAITGDVRGTYTPIFPVDGLSRLTINMYNASGDARNYNAASNGTIILNNNPLTTTNGSAVVSVLAPNHQLTDGENVTISGALTTSNITAAQLNIKAAVTIVDENNFTYVSNGAANANGQGGGDLVSMTPRFGNLYQTTTGRFGVSQFSVPVF